MRSTFNLVIRCSGFNIPTSLICQHNRCEYSILRLRRLKDIFPAIERGQRRNAEYDDCVVVQEGPVDNAKTVIQTDLFVNGRLVQEMLKWFRLNEAKIVHINECLEFWRQFGIVSDVEEPETRVDEVRLPLLLAAAQ